MPGRSLGDFRPGAHGAFDSHAAAVIHGGMQGMQSMQGQRAYRAYTSATKSAYGAFGRAQRPVSKRAYGAC
jgi:hypothetical protein